MVVDMRWWNYWYSRYFTWWCCCFRFY
jgi:hypothetical protein